MERFFAHSVEGAPFEVWQGLREHLGDVGSLAANFAEPFGAAAMSRLAGLLHDLGKYNPAFQRYIAGKGSSVDHATAGAAVLMQRAAAAAPGLKAVLELLAHAIAGHHGGMPDRLLLPEATGRSLVQRLEAFDEATLDTGWQEELGQELEAILTGVAGPLFPPAFRVDGRTRGRSPDTARAFQLAFLGRMVFSCLVDADFKDTEIFYSGIAQETPDREWPDLRSEVERLRAGFDAYMAAKAQTAKAGPLNSLRGTILSHVRARAGDAPGLFSLNVPTGGGKTLASLGFALDHAAIHGHRRIIYACPFTSIIDQTAQIFQEVLGSGMVLEHHSAIEEDKIEERGQRDKLKLAMEDWAAPVIVTTNVQLFESLFANRPGRCRKLHNIARSVIILDEAQTLPLHLLKPAVMALDELARNYGCTILLCTATQPALDRRDYEDDPLLGLALEGRELAPDPAGLARQLRRATIRHGGTLADDDLVRALAETPQALVIVNSRKHALDLYRAAQAEGLEGLVHLTTRQCAAHRKLILDDVRQRLKGGAPCRVIATSLIEAGVDVDFPRVWRAEAGLDQVLQAAGRCNREGRKEPEESVVTVFAPENHTSPQEMRQLAEVFRSISGKHDDLFSPLAVKAYFQELYWRRGAGLDRENILDLVRWDVTGTQMSYRSIAERFRMIETAMVPVIIPYDDEARGWIDKLSVETLSSGTLARKLQRHVVQVPKQARDLLINAGHVSFQAPHLRADQFAVLGKASGLYKPDVGLIWENSSYALIEDFVF
ncbi:CRISPR-associated endonuclease Cas3'' [Pannonibacter sp. P2PFMT1]|uniref:CRISPR-associated endonuclease Cas3'' n=1 Tax=Pannonibacter sp. P2PFMT1 TaxID=2003582 RepID=UPI0016446F64|nr:CRISPR-associated endonuclease Cas3'' [Pannonibacter sp. P2PFMT1]